jgi:hypothetical protein
MKGALQAKVVDGHLVMDEPTELPEGTIVDLVVADDWDDLDDEERAALHESIDESLRQIDSGQTRPVEELIRELRARR